MFFTRIEKGAPTLRWFMIISYNLAHLFDHTLISKRDCDPQDGSPVAILSQRFASQLRDSSISSQRVATFAPNDSPTDNRAVSHSFLRFEISTKVLSISFS